MKKLFSLGLIFLLLSGFCTSTSIAKTDDIDVLLIPYQRVIDELSEDLGAPFYVEGENKERFYNNVKDMTPKEFEKLLKDEYKETEKYKR